MEHGRALLTVQCAPLAAVAEQEGREVGGRTGRGGEGSREGYKDSYLMVVRWIATVDK